MYSKKYAFLLFAVLVSFQFGCSVKSRGLIESSKKSEVKPTAAKSEVKQEAVALKPVINFSDMKFGSKSVLGQSYLIDDKTGEVKPGNNCYSGQQVEEKNLDSVFYRLESKFDPKTRAHTLKAEAFHVTRAVYLKDVALTGNYKNLVRMTTVERKARCGDKTVTGNFEGQSASYIFQYKVDPRNGTPDTFVKFFGNSAQEVAQMNQQYGKIMNFKNGANTAGEADVLLMLTKSMSEAKTASKNDGLTFVEVTQAPQY